jgi:microcystin-dependent protein
MKMNPTNGIGPRVRRRVRTGLVTAVVFGGLATSLRAVTPQTTVQPSLPLSFLVQQSGNFNDGGSIHMFAGTFVPGGARADGSLLPINSDTESLFNVTGTTYGGDGVSNFALPDLNGRAIIGTGFGPALTPRALADTVGVNSTTLTIPQLPTGFGGQGQPINNVQPSLAQNFLIATHGVFPNLGGGTPSNPFYGQIIADSSDFLANSGGNFVPADGRLLPVVTNQSLFTLIGTTYGGDGQTNFAVPDLRGRVAIGAGTGPGLTPRTLGSTVGTESTTLTGTNLPPPRGIAAPYSNMQPSLALNYLIATSGIFPSSSFSASLDDTSPVLGEITLSAEDFVPTGWTLCNGRQLLIANNTALFSLIGTTYGGDGVTTFNLPDLRGRVATGADFGSGLGGLDPMEIGVLTGVEALTLSSSQVPPTPEPVGVGLIVIAAMMLGRRRGRGGARTTC